MKLIIGQEFELTQEKHMQIKCCNIVKCRTYTNLSMACEVVLAAEISTCSSSSPVSKCLARRRGRRLGMFRYCLSAGAMSSRALQSASKYELAAISSYIGSGITKKLKQIALAVYTQS